jgi:hypothetical protein
MAINQATRRDQTDNFLLFLCFYILPVVIVWPFSFILIAIFFFYIFGKPTSHICIDYMVSQIYSYTKVKVDRQMRQDRELLNYCKEYNRSWCAIVCRRINLNLN